MAVSRLPRRIVVIVEQRENAAPALCAFGVSQRRRTSASDAIAIAFFHVAQDLVVGAVFTHDQKHVLDERRIADMCFGIGMRLGPPAAAALCGLHILTVRSQ